MMKKVLLVLTAVFVVCFAASGVLAYTINDDPNDAIGHPIFETYGINVLNFTPGQNNGGLALQLFTNYPEAGDLVGTWDTKPADVFITETYYGVDYLWAVPLVNHDGFNAGTTYAVKSFNVSDFFDPKDQTYIYNHNTPVRIATQGTNYGLPDLGAGSVTWNSQSPSINPNYRVDVQLGWWEDDPNAKVCVFWGTSTCGNDKVGCVPLPGAVLLLGAGLVRLVAYARRREDTQA
jgi:hypothetical protein